MAFQPAPAVAQALMRYTVSGTGAFAYSNVINVQKDANTAYTLADLQQLGEVLATWWGDHGDGVTASAFTLASVELRGLESQAAAYWSEPVGTTGVASGDPLPINVAACITLRTVLTGRSARGRLFHGGMAESQTNGSSIVAGVITGLNDAYAALLDAINNDTVGTWVVLSRTQGGVKLANAIGYEITSASLRDGTVDSQRGRLDRIK